MTIASQKIRTPLIRGQLMRRSCGSRGRIAIRLSCCASQLAMLRIEIAVALNAECASSRRSRCRRRRRRALRLSAPPAVRRGRVGAAPLTADGDRDRPGLVALVGVRLDLAGREQRLQVGLRPAARARLEQLLRDVAVDAALESASTDRASGNAVIMLEVLRDRTRAALRGHRDRHRLARADHLAHAARVDDEVVADVDAPLVRERDEVRQRRRDRVRAFVVRRIEHQQELAAAA